MTVVEEIQEIGDGETRAWSDRDVETLLDVFHPDMVWPWPPDAATHDPAGWIFVLGRYDRGRWGENWRELFASHELVHNRRRTVKIEVTPEGDGAYAVVDIDTLWRSLEGDDFPWRGRACKVYTKVDGRWWMIFQTGLLDYGSGNDERAVPGP